MLVELDLPRGAKPLHLIQVLPGSFVMGRPPGIERWDGAPRATHVTITDPYWFGAYPVTQAQWTAVMGQNPSCVKHLRDNAPVDSVSWFDAWEFCEALNARLTDWLPPTYRFALPSQAQWEFACRCPDTEGREAVVIGKEILATAWLTSNSRGRTHPVGNRQPNRRGFYDMIGNVEEWCMDALKPYPGGEVTDWYGTRCPEPVAARDLVISRGWSIWDSPNSDRPACSDFRYVFPFLKREVLGFRIALRKSFAGEVKHRSGLADTFAKRHWTKS